MPLGTCRQFVRSPGYRSKNRLHPSANETHCMIHLNVLSRCHSGQACRHSRLMYWQPTLTAEELHQCFQLTYAQLYVKMVRREYTSTFSGDGKDGPLLTIDEVPDGLWFTKMSLSRRWILLCVPKSKLGVGVKIFVKVVVRGKPVGAFKRWH